jgi:hypothetical protein
VPSTTTAAPGALPPQAAGQRSDDQSLAPPDRFEDAKRDRTGRAASALEQGTLDKTRGYEAKTRPTYRDDRRAKSPVGGAAGDVADPLNGVFQPKSAGGSEPVNVPQKAPRLMTEEKAAAEAAPVDESEVDAEAPLKSLSKQAESPPPAPSAPAAADTANNKKESSVGQQGAKAPPPTEAQKLHVDAQREANSGDCDRALNTRYKIQKVDLDYYKRNVQNDRVFAPCEKKQNAEKNADKNRQYAPQQQKKTKQAPSQPADSTGVR